MINSLPLEDKVLKFIKEAVKTPFIFKAGVEINSYRLVPAKEIPWLELSLPNIISQYLRAGLYYFKKLINKASNFNIRAER